MAPMEWTAETAPPKEGRFTRAPEAPEAAPPPVAPPADLASLRLVERRWPRAVPPKRIFPRG
jgi:hypothetical protein